MITVRTEDVVHSKEDYKITTKDPDLHDAEIWLQSGCSREVAREWHNRVLARLHITQEEEDK